MRGFIVRYREITHREIKYNTIVVFIYNNNNNNNNNNTNNEYVEIRIIK
jgi:hypothetical protein